MFGMSSGYYPERASFPHDPRKVTTPARRNTSVAMNRAKSASGRWSPPVHEAAPPDHNGYEAEASATVQA